MARTHRRHSYRKSKRWNPRRARSYRRVGSMQHNWKEGSNKRGSRGARSFLKRRLRRAERREGRFNPRRGRGRGRRGGMKSAPSVRDWQGFKRIRSLMKNPKRRYSKRGMSRAGLRRGMLAHLGQMNPRGRKSRRFRKLAMIGFKRRGHRKTRWSGAGKAAWEAHDRARSMAWMMNPAAKWKSIPKYKALLARSFGDIKRPGARFYGWTRAAVEKDLTDFLKWHKEGPYAGGKSNPRGRGRGGRKFTSHRRGRKWESTVHGSLPYWANPKHKRRYGAQHVQHSRHYGGPEEGGWHYTETDTYGHKAFKRPGAAAAYAKRLARRTGSKIGYSRDEDGYVQHGKRCELARRYRGRPHYE